MYNEEGRKESTRSSRNESGMGYGLDGCLSSTPIRFWRLSAANAAALTVHAVTLGGTETHRTRPAAPEKPAPDDGVSLTNKAHATEINVDF